ncbi:glycosyltransferase [Bacteroides intestinalis]|uniref:glycosyltransferase n=1 Tax=Bacteroides intestinalis TaxID=329854 RepID=UPI0015F5EF2F|nr:glycosyltransferase [Bacteroides intestinalis]
MDNIRILKDFGCKVDVAANFQEGSITSQKRVDEFKNELIGQNINVLDVLILRNIFQISKIVQSYRMVKNLVEIRHYRIVHCHSPIGGVVARLACRTARKPGTKVVYTGHGLHFFQGAPFVNCILFYPIERLCSRITDVLIAINQEDYFREKSWNTYRVEYVPSIGVDTDVFQNGVIGRLFE